MDAGIADLFVEMGLMTLVGLGAGRPETAVKLFVTAFGDNPWTPDSTARVFRMFPPGGEDRLVREGVLPWREIARGARLTGDSEQCSWDHYISDPVMQQEIHGRRGRATLWSHQSNEDAQVLRVVDGGTQAGFRQAGALSPALLQNPKGWTRLLTSTTIAMVSRLSLTSVIPCRIYPGL